MKNIITSRKTMILTVNTLELVIGMIGLGIDSIPVTVCCLFLLSLNPLLLHSLLTHSQKTHDSADTKEVAANTDCAGGEVIDAIGNHRTAIDMLPVLPSGLLPLYPECTDWQVELLPFLNELLQEFDFALSAIAAHTIIHSPADSITVKAPLPLFRLVFLNIMDNTLKYLPKSGTITITLSILDAQALLIWKDNGNGVSDSEVNNLFDLNYQGSNRLQGTGLGLLQVQAAIKKIGGSIYVKSSTGKGFALYLHLPLTECQQKGHQYE